MSATANERTPLLTEADVQETNISNVAVDSTAAGRQAENGVATKRQAGGRELAIDLYRGIVMILMALDHAVFLMPWPHGQGFHTEEPGVPIVEFTTKFGYFARTLSHLCAPAFHFLLGVGIAYFEHSRIKRDWTNYQFVYHYGVRAVAMVVINTIINLPKTIVSAESGHILWAINAVLWSLAIDYFLVGLLSLALTRLVEPQIALWSRRSSTPTNGHHASGPGAGNDGSTVAKGVSFALLTVLVVVTFLWNGWFWPSDLQCVRTTLDDTSVTETLLQKRSYNLLFELLFHTVNRPDLGIFSFFPPFAWIAYSIFGLLYGRVLLAKRADLRSVAMYNALAGALLALLFVWTRLGRWGDPAVHCLQTAEQLAHPLRNPYLCGVRSFFYLSKYPPFLPFASYTLSVAFFALSLLSLLRSPDRTIPGRVLLVYGTNALFFYMFHVLFYQLAAAVLVHGPLARTVPWSPDEHLKGINPWWLALVVWLGNLTVSYYACKAYARFKSGKGADSVWRFL